MTNLVYAKQPMTPLTKSVLENIRKESDRKFEEIWREHLLYGNQGFRIDNIAPMPGKTVTFRRVDTPVAGMLALAERDGVAPEFAGDHARDMGLAGSFRALREAQPIHESFKVGTLSVYHNARTQIWTFTDDRGVTISMTEAVIRRLPTAGIMHKDPLRMALLVIRPGADKLRRNLIVEDDRGCRYPVEVMRPVHVINCPIPNRDIFPISGSITKSTNNKEARMGTATKSTTKETTEKPIQQQPVRLGAYFRVNSMPQELTQKQVIEHVTKLLSLGAAEVNVMRFIRDETSEKYTNQVDYRS